LNAFTRAITSRSHRDLPELISASAVDLAHAAHHGALLDRIGDARLVLIGEASHGTHEFYRERAEITKRLIVEKGFRAVAVEADWPDGLRVNRWVRGLGSDAAAIGALEGFQRFPAWMWRNLDVLDFVGWLRARNDAAGNESLKTGFYGLDLYSLSASIAAVIDYLDGKDPDAALAARTRYSCFDHFNQDPQAYGAATSRSQAFSCEEEVIQQLLDLQRRAADLSANDGPQAADEFFYAEQNARLACNAEEYYRAMYRGRVSSWNLRDQHMMETLEALLSHLDRQQGAPAKVVVWAHNSHLGNAQATEMHQRGEFNLGQLVRERYRENAVLIGFTTFTGTVTAASDWDGPAFRKQVRPALPGSYERLFHDTGKPGFLLSFLEQPELANALRAPQRLERAIGVIYVPETERHSHYFYCSLPDQFDAVLHFDETRAVEPLEQTAHWQDSEPAETFPTGL
jgi:erythromycin esterase-like protein